MVNKILLIGAGVSNLVLARLFKDDRYDVTIIEKEKELGGMCKDIYDNISKCYINLRGPHILHFNKDTMPAFNFLSKYAELIDFNHKVMCIGNSSFTYWPANKNYIKIFNILNPNKDFEKEFVNSYSKKFWGKNYKEILENTKRFKFKDNYNTDFFENEKVVMPKNGYSNLFKEIVSGIKIIYEEEININTIKDKLKDFKYVFVSAPIDKFFNNIFGKLDWVGLYFYFIKINNNGENVLPTPVVNLNTHPDITRITECNQLYNNNSTQRILSYEQLNKKETFYPVLTSKNLKILEKYNKYSKTFPNIIFIGRAGEYKYKNMDIAIMDSINMFNSLKGGDKDGRN